MIFPSVHIISQPAAVSQPMGMIGSMFKLVESITPFLLTNIGVRWPSARDTQALST